MTEPLQIPELLAPAGSFDALRAAVANRADAVYLGIDRLNARRGAENFTLEGLSEAVAFAHLAGVRVYLTANIVVLEDEMADALEVVDAAWAAGIDAVIVQDLGLLGLLAKALPHVRVHASTQVNAHNSATVRTLAALGVSRVTLAREVELTEIERLVAAGREVGVEVESFAHGALCMCYSGQCLLSSLIGGRSANRGLCAQPCRLPYELLDAEARVLPAEGRYLLSPRDLAAIDILPRLLGTGVAAIKLEGRMKSPEYVAIVTGTYRAALDRLASAPEEFEVRDGERSALAEAFSRGFTTAYLTGERGGDMMSYTRPSNRGVAVGRVVATRTGSATIELDRALEAADTIEIWTGQGRVAQRVGTMRVSGREQASAPSGARVEIVAESPVAKGDRVFRVASAALLEAARRTWQSGRTSPLTFDVHVVRGEALSITVTDSSGRSGSATGPTVEVARTKPITAEEISEHVGRLGGTRYEAAGWRIDLSPDVGLGYSLLHRVRREAIDAYEAAVLEPWSHRALTCPTLPALAKASTQRVRGNATSRSVRLAVACDSLELAEAAIDEGADEAHVPTWALRSQTPRAGVVPLVDRITHDSQWERALAVASGGEAAIVGNLGALDPLAQAGCAMQAHWGLNCVNPWAAETLARLGATSIWASPELTGRQLGALVARSPVRVGTAVWGRQELMVTEHCIISAGEECTRRCGTCVARGRAHVLRDRKGFEFPVRTDPLGRSHVYNSVPLDLAHALPDVLATGCSALRLDLTVETRGEALAQVRRWRSLLDARIAAIAEGGRAAREWTAEPERPSTTGHFFRGVS